MAISLVLAVLIARRTPVYEAQARLAYSASGISVSSSETGLASGRGAPVKLATEAVRGAQLSALIERYDLYPQLRQKQSASQVADHLRSQLTFSEPEPGLLQVAFRDSVQETTRSVTNDVATYLANYVTTIPVPAPVQPVVAVKERSRRHSHSAGASAAPLPVKPQVVVPHAAPQTSIISRPNPAAIAALTQQIARVDSALADLQSARDDLQSQQRQVETKMAAVEKSERRTEARPLVDSNRTERAVAEQDLTAEQAKLAALRDRYTEQYPDVQRTEEEIANLQAKLARMPPPARPARQEPVASADQQAAMEKLREERSRIDRDLSTNANSAAAEQQRKAGLEASIRGSRIMLAAPVAAPVIMPQATPVVPQTPPAAPLAITTVSVSPFRLVESAGPAGLVGTSRFALSLWLALATVVLLALCFVPLVPAHYAAVVTTAEDLHDGVPEHVTYLGEVGRTEP